MRLEIENIGRIKKADVELNGITVIAGDNTSGKSTVGKVLYSIFNSFYRVEEQIYNEKADSIYRILNREDYFLSRGFRQINISDSKYSEVIDRLLVNPKKYINDVDLLKNLIINNRSEDLDIPEINEDIINEDENINDIVNKILKILELSNDRILETLVLRRLNLEFNNQINNIYLTSETEGRITLTIRKEALSIIVKKDAISNISNNYSLNTEVIYIDDPYVLDEINLRLQNLRIRKELNHRDQLKLKLSQKNTSSIVDELIINNRLSSIYEKINSVCSGDIVVDKNKFGYRKKDKNTVLDIKNISTGLKTFVIIKTLLQNGSLSENGTIILDEPEIHLHPKWQLILAELIALIQKEFNMNILLNTHSPYFLRAIEVYSANYGIANKCKYYLSENKGDISNIKDVTTNTESIYEKLTKPLETLQIERYKND